jgi:hypothetical protein
LGSIPLSNCEVLAAQEETKKKNCFKVYHSSRRVYYMYAENYNEMVDWIRTIHQVIDKLSVGKMKPTMGTLLEERDASYQFMYGM